MRERRLLELIMDYELTVYYHERYTNTVANALSQKKKIFD